MWFSVYQVPSLMQVMLLLVNLALAAEVPTISLEEAVERAAERAPSVRAAEAGSVAAQAQLHQAWTARLPTINVSGNVLVYDDDQTFSLIQTDEPIDCAPFEAVGMGALCEGFGKETVVREQVTSSLTTRAVLPLTGQVAIDRSVAAARAARDASGASRDATVLDARWQAEDAWYGALQVERQLAIAEGQARGLESRVRTAQTALAAGTLTRSDLLLAELALAQAKQRVFQLEAARDASFGALGLAIGNGGEPVRPQAPAEGPPRLPPDVEVLTTRALAGHPNLSALRHTADAARASAQAASWGRLPSISAMAAWQHTEGQGMFGEPDTYFAGAQLDWNVWAWGKANAGVKAANASATRVATQVEQAEAGVRLDVHIRARNLAAAAAAYEVATASIAQAEENMRITEARLAAGSATMQEVLDADVALLQARSSQATALYDARRAEAALTRAVGADPWGE